jgi:hypothetical protein
MQHQLYNKDKEVQCPSEAVFFFANALCKVMKWCPYHTCPFWRKMFSLPSRSHASELEQPSFKSRIIGREEFLLNSINIIPYNQENEMLYTIQAP